MIGSKPRTRLLLVCSLLFIHGCAPLFHEGGFHTQQYGEYIVKFDSSGNCIVHVNGKDRFKSKLSTIFESYSESSFHQKQAKENSSDISAGRVSCYKKKQHTENLIQSSAVDLTFDPSRIKDGIAIYGRQETTIGKADAQEELKSTGRLISPELVIEFGSERQAGVSIPGGVCSGVELRGSTFKLERVSLDNGLEEYTVTGRGRYVCKGTFN